MKLISFLLAIFLPLAGWSEDQRTSLEFCPAYHKLALENSLRCLETIRGDDYRTALTRIWAAENLAYLGDQKKAVGILRESTTHYLIPYGCVETGLVQVGHAHTMEARELISLGIQFLPFAVGKGAELVQFQLLKMATVLGDQQSVQSSWAAETVTKVNHRSAYEGFMQDWNPNLLNRLQNLIQPMRHWQGLQNGASRDQEIAWNAERTVDFFTALLFIQEAKSRVRRGESYPSHWIFFARAGVNSAAVNTRPAAIQAELAELAALEGKHEEARMLVSSAGKMLVPWAPQMTGVYKIERDLALVLASVPDKGDERAEFIKRLRKRIGIMAKSLDSYEQMLQLPLLAEALYVLAVPDEAQATWKTAAELCASNQNAESQSIGLTRIWMSYARANAWPPKDTEALLTRVEKKLPAEYAKVNF
jgi:hypothetical protein